MTTVEVVPDWPRMARIQWWLAIGGASLLAMFCALAVVFTPRAVDSAIVGSRPVVVAWLVGLLVQMLGLPLLAGIALALAASVIGIPLLAAIPFVLLGIAAMNLVGVAAFAVRIGYRLLPPPFRRGPSVVALLAGFVVLAGPGLVGSYLWHASGGTSFAAVAVIALGAFIEYTWWTVGLGAGVLAWRRRGGRPTPARATTPTAPIDSMPLPSQI